MKSFPHASTFANLQWGVIQSPVFDPFSGARVLPILFFALWAVVFTYPLVFNLSDGIVLSMGGDGWQNLWNLWWTRFSLFELNQNPYESTFLQYPSGVSLLYHPLNLVTGIASVPLQLVSDLTTTFNLLVLASLTLSGYIAYLLCLDRTRNRAAALLGGALYSSSALIGQSLDRGQLEHMSAWWLPLYLLALFRALDSPGKLWERGGGRRAVLAMAICLAGASLTTWYFTSGLLIFTAAFVPFYQLLKVRRGELVPSAGWHGLLKPAFAIAIMAVALSPLLWAMVGERLSGQTYMLAPSGTILYNSADLAAPFVPADFLEGSDAGRHGNIALGYVALALGLFALRADFARLWPLGLATLVPVILALGPELQVLGRSTGIPLPYALLEQVPLIGASRQPLRFLGVATLGLALLAAFGIRYLLSRRWVMASGRVTTLLTLGVLTLAALELFDVPRAIASTGVSPAYELISERTEAGGVIEVPVQPWQAKAMWHQTVHGRPIFGGYIARHYPYPLFSEPVPGVNQLVLPAAARLDRPDILSPSPGEVAGSSLHQYGVRFIVAHKSDLAQPEYEPVQKALAALFSERDRIYSDGEIDVYFAPEAPARVLAGLGKGWDAVEGEGTELRRWLEREGEVWLHVPDGLAGRYRLDFEANSYRVPRNVAVLVDGRQIARAQVGARGATSIDLGDLQPGDHTILLRSEEPPEVPPDDNRAVSVAFFRLALVRTGP
jgi:hypothetical protein